MLMLPTPVHVYDASDWTTYAKKYGGGWFVGVPVECVSRQCKGQHSHGQRWGSFYVRPDGAVLLAQSH